MSATSSFFRVLGADASSGEQPQLEPGSVPHPETRWYEPTLEAVGPWSKALLHGGPPAALLAHHLEPLAPAGSIAVRLTVEMFRPVGLQAIAVSATRLREGARVSWFEASLYGRDGGGLKECMRARGLWARPEAISIEPRAEPLPCPPGDGASVDFPVPWSPGYHTAMEIVSSGEGPSKVTWFRPRVALVAGLAWSPLTRLMVTADALGGVSTTLDFARWTFVNPELSCHLVRPPGGEWIGIGGTSRAEPNGVGLAEARLYDVDGCVGRAAEVQVIGVRQAGRS